MCITSSRLKTGIGNLKLEFQEIDEKFFEFTQVLLIEIVPTQGKRWRYEQKKPELHSFYFIRAFL